MPIDKKLLDILCCPVSKKSLVVLKNDKLKLINQDIKQGKAQYVDGTFIKEPLQAALITEDKKVLYRIKDDIPVMLEEEGIGTTQFDFF